MISANVVPHGVTFSQAARAPIIEPEKNPTVIWHLYSALDICEPARKKWPI